MRSLFAAAFGGAVVATLLSQPSSAHADSGLDAAARFGARPHVEHISLSPDGTRIAYIMPTQQQGSTGVVADLEQGARPRPFIIATGKPERLSGCNWVSENRFVCGIYGTAIAWRDAELPPYSRLVAVDRDGSNLRLLSTRNNVDSAYYNLNGGQVIDWLPDETGQVLMQRAFLPDVDDQRRAGIAVDRIDTASLKYDRIEPVRKDADEYITDGRGRVRIMGISHRASPNGQLTGVTSYHFRRANAPEWEKLSEYDSRTGEGFNPYAVDPDLDVAYGFEKTNGRLAVWRTSLDGSGKHEMVMDHPDVDVDRLVRIGRRNRVVGASYATDVRVPVYFDEEIGKVMTALHKALPDQPLIRIVQSSMNERKFVVWAGADNDPGVYYFFDRDKRTLTPMVNARPELEGVKLARVKAISYPAADGTLIPGYLTLPPEGSGRNLPAIVLPHGGPSARDEWGFDWLSQFFAHQGYAVLQPNFRGSAGYGDAWFQQNGFVSWKTAIGDVVDAGKWLVKEGIADPKQLGIVGWSYGGYAALQSTVIEPALFKAAIAIAPVTDLATLKTEWKGWANYRLQSDFIGSGPHIREGSPAQNAERIGAPILLFHGNMDRNVNIDQSILMARRLKQAGKPHDLIRFEGLDHYLEDADARTRMLRDSDAFLRKSFGN